MSPSGARGEPECPCHPIHSRASTAIHVARGGAVATPRARSVWKRCTPWCPTSCRGTSSAMLVDYELQLFRMADQARNQGVQGAHFKTLRVVRQNRADLVPHFMIGLEKSLSQIREPVSAPITQTDAAIVGVPRHAADR